METGQRVAIRIIDMLNRIKDFELVKCKFCRSQAVVRNGKRNGTQYWLCKDCGHGFVDNDALPKGKYPMDIVSKAVYDYYAGMSMNDIAEGIDQQTGNKPSKSNVYRWVEKLTEIGLKEAEKYHPQVGDKWIVDETVIRLSGKKYWLINIIDSDSRFLLASMVSKSRNMKDIQKAMETARDKADKTPKLVLSDGWKGYLEGIEMAFGADTKHIMSKPFTEKELSTNLVERWHGTLKDRYRPMRGLDKTEDIQPILNGFVFYYNYIRPHESLNDRTPAEAANTKYPYKSFQDILHSQIPKEERSLIIDVVRYGGGYMPVRKPYRKRTKPKAKPKRNKQSRERETISQVSIVRR